MKTVLATQGDTLDLIVFYHAGGVSGGILEETLLLNPHLCDNAQTVLEAGTPVNLPALARTSGQAVKKTIQLWD